MRRRRAAIGAAAALAVVAVAAGCSPGKATWVMHSSASPAPAPAVALALGGQLHAPVTIGLIVTTTVLPGDGSDDLPMAAGADVAAYRLSTAGHQVTIDVADDDGTPAGARSAVHELLGKKVSAIVDASEGSHVAAGVDEAEAAGTAVLLPYDDSTSLAASGKAWLTGPSGAEYAAAMRRYLASVKATDPLVLAGPETPAAVTGLPHALVLRASETGAAPGLAAALHTVGANQPHHALVIWASARPEVALLAAAQQADVTAPILVGPAALTPTFADAAEADEQAGQLSLDSGFVSFGEPASDADSSAAMTGFLQALHLAAADHAVTAALQSTPLASSLPLADTRSHDAVIAVAAAAAKARSSSPAAVAQALQGLQVTAADGLAGPPLDFANPLALTRPGADIVPLQATTQDLGRRDDLGATPSPLTWFPVPTAG